MNNKLYIAAQMLLLLVNGIYAISGYIFWWLNALAVIAGVAFLYQAKGDDDT